MCSEFVLVLVVLIRVHFRRNSTKIGFEIYYLSIKIVNHAYQAPEILKLPTC